MFTDFVNERDAVDPLRDVMMALDFSPFPESTQSHFEHHDHAGFGVAFIFVNPNEAEQLEQLQNAVNTHEFPWPYVRVGKKQLLEAMVAETTTEFFLLDRARTPVYRGAVDDQYGFPVHGTRREPAI